MKKKVNKSSNPVKQNKKGFTLIELLAVIIILGILMIIAIPSVTKYISDSRKSAYVDTAKEIVSGTRNVVNDGKLEMYDTNTTYYIPYNYIQTENASKSPYGEFTEAYVGVVYDGKGYKYYWISTDDAGQGVEKITMSDNLEENDIVSDLTSEKIEGTVKTTGIGNRSTIKILDVQTGSWNVFNAEDAVSEAGDIIVCKKATELHEVKCTATANSCKDQFGTGNMIIYGTIPGSTPKAGDAYDCDVNNDGVFDSETERFYYLTRTGNKVSLIYYKNSTNQDSAQYAEVEENWHGPKRGYQYLPSTSEWANPGLILPGTRQIVAENGNASTAGGPIESFTYTSKAARLLTAQEVVSACDNVVIGEVKLGQIDSCYWLMESLARYENGYEGGITNGYWLETPVASTSTSVYVVMSPHRFIHNLYAYFNNTFGIRPVIEVWASSLEK